MGSALPAPLPASTGTTFYVAATGSDSSPGTQAQPWRTIQKALNTLTAGQRALVRAGTYSENLNMSRAGTAAAPITVEAFPGERPVLTSAGNHPLRVETGGAYFRFRGFTIERSPLNSGGNVDLYGHHLEISGNEIRLGQDQGIYTAEESHHAQILGNWIHDNGKGIAHQSHGIYLQGDDHLVANNVINDHVEGFGIQVYDKGDRAIVTANTITGAGHSGIVVGGSGGVSGVRVHNNVLAFNAQWGISARLELPVELGRRPQCALRQRRRADASRLLGPQLRGRKPHHRPAVRQLREPRPAPAGRQPRARLRPARVHAVGRPRRRGSTARQRSRLGRGRALTMTRRAGRYGARPVF